MKIRSKDVPQAPRLDRIRRVVDAVGRAGRSVTEVAAAAKMKPRDAQYHLNAAERVLGLVSVDDGLYVLTKEGRRLVEAEPGGDQERSVLTQAVRTSPVVKRLAGDLLGARPPKLATVSARIRETGLAADTAQQRAKGLLRWRAQLLETQPDLLRTASVARESAEARAAYHRRVDQSLVSLALRDFKSFADVEIPLAPLTLFVGANASGKSNVLDALRFLQGIASELTISDILRGRHEGGRELWPAIRGGAAEICRGDTNQFGLRSRWRIDGEHLEHQLDCDIAKVPCVVRESLSLDDTSLPLFDTHAKTLGAKAGVGAGHSLAVALERRSGGRRVTQQHSAMTSLLGQLERADIVTPRVYKWTSRLQDVMREATFLDIRPSQMRDYAPAQAFELGADARNVSPIVKQLCDTNADWRDRIVSWLSELCAPRLRDIDFVETELGDVMLVLVEEDGTRISARSLSDGTLRFLGQLIALLTASPGSLLLVEEIENGLHPQRSSLLVELLEGITADRGIQVIATTHSPTILAALSKSSLENAVVFGRVPELEGTQARRLGDLPHFSEVAERRGVERLFSTGWLERAM